MAHKRGDKIIIFKFKRRKNYRLKKGHRQSLTSLKIIDVQA
jgi:large subunit ribosomal protein L27